jgi:hypothetical protein
VEKFYRDVKLCTIGEGHQRNPASGDCPAATQEQLAVTSLNRDSNLLTVLYNQAY